MKQDARQALVVQETRESEDHPVRQAILDYLGTLQGVKTGRERRFFLCARGGSEQ